MADKCILWSLPVLAINCVVLVGSAGGAQVRGKALVVLFGVEQLRGGKESNSFYIDIHAYRQISCKIPDGSCQETVTRHLLKI